MAGRVTRKDVSRIAGVSTATVSNVLNGKSNVSEAVRKRVLQVIEELDYKPNLVARSLITNKTFQVAILLDDITDPHHSAIVDSFQREAAKAGYFVSVNIRDENLDKLFDSMISRGIEGVFLMISPNKYVSDVDTMESIMKLASSGVKVVAGFSGFQNLGKFSVVQLDFGDAMEQAVLHLKSFGHREIGLLNIFPGDYPYDSRYQAFCDAMQRHLGVENPTIVHGQAPFPGHINTGELYTIRMLKQNPNITAIIGANDLLSIGCVSYLINNGYHVPLDISVITTGDVSLFRYFKPALTAFTINHREYGKSAFDMLLNSIENNSTHISSLKLKLTERQTVSNVKKGG